MTSADSSMSGDDAVRSLATPGAHAVDVPIMCSMTRFGLRNARSMLPSYTSFRRMRDAAREAPVPGLLRSAFLVENPKAWFSVSIWAGEPAFSAQVPAHVDAARAAMGRLSYEPGRGPELWSTTWRLVSVTNNLNWGDFDLRQLIVDRYLTGERRDAF